MRSHLSLSLVSVCLLALTSAPIFGQTSAEDRKSYDAAVQGAKRDLLNCDADALRRLTFTAAAQSRGLLVR